ncbi:hypothetical protein L2E82_19250 [Cichorium intybus]|uniref:Uncharacterized protein n=1 Tax=Cichorium intybus TaxID=13427 RepID=A0ACB9FBI8_CICIN|nr:hypothetical protein L2E82_19250 [Cichorium intybus]
MSITTTNTAAMQFSGHDGRYTYSSYCPKGFQIPRNVYQSYGFDHVTCFEGHTCKNEVYEVISSLIKELATSKEQHKIIGWNDI